jgi:predicted MFS family arabinose efflux permease
MAVFAFNFMDRQILAILVEPIKRELAVSDALLGLLYGFAFAVFYTTVGVPIARLADRGNRARIITWSLTLFSVMTALCGLAASYWQLLLARVGVAVGEGGTNPPSHSMISDLFPVERRSTAMAIFALGPHVGILLGFLVGGAIGQRFGWRAAFIVAGLSGLVLATVSRWLLRDPTRGHARGMGGRATELPAAGAVWAALWHRASMRQVFIGGAVATIASYAIVGWLPAFLMRSHGLSTAAAGIALAVMLGLMGGVGTLAGGIIADRLGRRDAAWRMRVVTVAFVLAAAFWVIALFATSAAATLTLLLVPTLLLGVYIGPTFAMVQSVVEPRMRAVAAALLLLVGNIVGLGLGPLAVGLLSDALQPGHGSESLRLALLVVPPIYLWGAYHYWRAGRTIGADLGIAAVPTAGRTAL